MFLDFVAYLFLLLLKSFRVAGFKVRLVADMAQKFLSENVLMSLYLITYIFKIQPNLHLPDQLKYLGYILGMPLENDELNKGRIVVF